MADRRDDLVAHLRCHVGELRWLARRGTTADDVRRVRIVDVAIARGVVAYVVENDAGARFTVPLLMLHTTRAIAVQTAQSRSSRSRGRARGGGARRGLGVARYRGR